MSLQGSSNLAVNPQDQQTRARAVCFAAGVKFVGIQRMYGVRADQLLFQPHERASTLAVDVTADAFEIQRRVAEAA